MPVGLTVGKRNVKSDQVSVVQYESNQGKFRAELPNCNILVVENEPSIENITKLTWNYLVNEAGVSANRLELRAFEGINKGARIESN